MTYFIYLIVLIGTFRLALVASYNVICYYDTFSINRLGTGNFTNKDLKNGLPLCDVVIYGYIGIDAHTFEARLLHPLQHQQLANVGQLKMAHRNVKFLLSLGGDKDLANYEKYFHLLEADARKQNSFIKSAVNLLLHYEFDGFDLAYQLPKKFTWTNRSDVRHKTEYYRKQMTQLIKQIEMSCRKNKLMLSLTVLPNVHAKSYYNMTAIMNSLDFVTLAAFDFSLPTYSPKEANYLAPLQALTKSKLRHANVLYALKQWTWTKQIPTNKLYLGITAHGRTWNTTKPLKNPKMPIVDLLNGPAPGGPITRTPGLLAWPEICKKLAKISKVTTPILGNFAYRPGLKKNDQGLLLLYENRDSVAEKVKFTKQHQLGGVAFFDLSTDDYRGRCWGERYELLKEIKKNLQES